MEQAGGVENGRAGGRGEEMQVNYKRTEGSLERRHSDPRHFRVRGENGGEVMMSGRLWSVPELQPSEWELPEAVSETEVIGRR